MQSADIIVLILKILSTLGPLGMIALAIFLVSPFGLLVLIWWMDQRTMWRVVESHRKETQAILNQYNKDMVEIRAMYKSNVKLVESYESIARDLHDLIVLNVQKLTTMKDSIDQNQFCPAARVSKKKIEVNKL